MILPFSFLFLFPFLHTFLFDLLIFLLAGNEDLVMPEISTDEAMTDATAASKKELKDFGVISESAHVSFLLLSFFFPLLYVLSFVIN